MKQRDIYEIVKTLTGNVRPVGSEHIDSERFENLKELGCLVLRLVDDLRCVAADSTRKEHSIQRAGIEASAFLAEIRESIS